MRRLSRALSRSARVPPPWALPVPLRSRARSRVLRGGPAALPLRDAAPATAAHGRKPPQQQALPRVICGQPGHEGAWGDLQLGECLCARVGAEKSTGNRSGGSGWSQQQVKQAKSSV